MVGPVKTLSGMRNLLGDELENVGVYAQRLLESGHPMLRKSRYLNHLNQNRRVAGCETMVGKKRETHSVKDSTSTLGTGGGALLYGSWLSLEGCFWQYAH